MEEKYNYTLVSTARDATKYPEMHRTAPGDKELFNPKHQLYWSWEALYMPMCKLRNNSVTMYIHVVNMYEVQYAIDNDNGEYTFLAVIWDW